MPTYSFRDESTQEVFDKLMPIAAKETYLAENPHLKQVFTGTGFLGIGDPVRLGLKNGVQGCVKEGDDGEGPSKDGEEGGNIVVKVAALLLDDHRHGRDVVDELGLRDSRLVVCHHLRVRDVCVC